MNYYSLEGGRVECERRDGGGGERQDMSLEKIEDDVSEWSFPKVGDEESGNLLFIDM